MEPAHQSAHAARARSSTIPVEPSRWAMVWCRAWWTRWRSTSCRRFSAAASCCSKGSGTICTGADAPRRAEVEITPRAHLPLFFCLELAPHIDAGHRLRDADDLLDRRIVGLPGDQPRLLVRDPPFTHRLSERREHAKPALQRDTLLDGALGHPQPFGAGVAER